MCEWPAAVNKTPGTKRLKVALRVFHSIEAGYSGLKAQIYSQLMPTLSGDDWGDNWVS